MEQCFVPTENVGRFDEICAELESRDSLIGPSLGMVIGPAGRGKSEAAKHHAALGNALYLPPMNVRSPLAVLREITFDLCAQKPGRIESCLEVIGSEMIRDRRLVIIDEADLLEMHILEMLRNVNERYACPMLLVGEDALKAKILSRRRLASRIRVEMTFGPVVQADIAVFLRRALKQDLGPDGTAMIQRCCKGDWRPVLTLTAKIDRAMAASGLKSIPIDLIKELTRE